MVAPIVDEIAKEFEGQIKVFKLNTDENPNVASQYGIRSIPTLMVFRDRVLLFNQPGALPPAALDEIVTKVQELDMDEIKAQIAEQQATQ